MSLHVAGQEKGLKGDRTIIMHRFLTDAVDVCVDVVKNTCICPIKEGGYSECQRRKRHLSCLANPTRIYEVNV